jgi:glutathione synthase/RimK-type ligase-like ATP-grasp enzyme
MTIAIYPYNNGSASAKALAEGLGCKVLRREGVRRKRDTIINWGCSVIERDIVIGKILNPVASVGLAANKLRTFQTFQDHDVPTVEWTTNPLIAYEYIARGGCVARKVLNGHSGQGIEIVTQDGDIPQAPLYTLYTKKKDEYRIHVFQGEVIFQQRKARKKEVPDEEVNWQVRNLAGGFIFANDGIVAPECVQEAAKKAVESIGLDFGAADVGFKDNQAVVYEVNTACGLQGKNLEAYVKKFKEFM